MSEVCYVWVNLLTLSRRRPLSCRNQSIDLLGKSMDWFLYDNGLCHKRVKLYRPQVTKQTLNIVKMSNVKC